MDADFETAEFWGATPRERSGRCREMAAEAALLASEATGATHDSYIRLAEQWSALADAMGALPTPTTHDG